MSKSKVQNLEELLKSSLDAGEEIVAQKSSLLTAPGEHYGSVMLALEVHTKKKSKSEEERILHLVAKLIPANAMLRIAFDIGTTFKKEVIAYTETIPALCELERECGFRDEELFTEIVPRCLGARICLDENKNEVDEDGVLVFENLKMQGFRTEDRLVGFDFAAAKLIVRDLSKFHATPLALKIRKPEIFKSAVMPALVKNKGLEQLPEEVGLAFHNSILEGAFDIPELQPHLGRLREISDYAAKNPFVNRPPPDEAWGTMSHSDFWTSNTMLKCDESGKAVKNKIVDLQMMSYSSAVRDLVFFLYTSVINEDLEQHHDTLVRVYYENFVKTLKVLGVDTRPYSWEAFLKELEDVAPTEVYHILVMLKPICTERGKVQNSLEDFQDSDWSRKDLLGPAHKRKLKDTVLALAQRNWL